MCDAKKIIEFPTSPDQRLESAIRRFNETKETQELIKEFTELVDNGYLEAWFYLGCLYEDGGEGLEPDLDKAVWYYRKSADDYGYLESVLAMGRLYFYGVGVNRELNKSLDYYLEAYKYRKDTVATFMLGRIYQDGAFNGKDITKAERYYREAIEHEFVYGYLYLSFLEREKGKWARSLYYRFKSATKAFFIANKEPRDKRLRPA